MSVKVAKGHKGVGMEGPIARWYAQITKKKIDDYKATAKNVAGAVSPGATILEIAPGPGYLSIELAGLGNYQVSGLDISHTFVEIARENARSAGVQVDFRQGDAAHMPFAADSFDYIVCQAAFKNFAAPIAALDEMYRVVKPGGTACILDLRRDLSPEAINRHVKEDLHLKGLNALMTRWTFQFMLIKRAYTKAQFEEMTARSQFKTCRIEENAIDLKIFLRKV